MLVSGGVELLTADGPPLGRGRSARAQRLVLTRIKCTLTHWFITADSPVLEPRTVRDFAEKSVTASFWRDVYIYPMPGHWVGLLAIWTAFLTH